MCEAAGRQGVLAERIASWTHAVAAWGREGEEMPELVVYPSRPGRYEPRVRSSSPSSIRSCRSREPIAQLREKDLAA